MEVVPSYLDVGVITKRITRYAGGIAIGASSLAYLDSDVLEDDLMRQGTGYGVDLGAKLKLPAPWNPSVSFAWQDVGDTSYSIKADTPGPTSTKSRMHVGVGLEEDFTAFVLRPAIDVRHLNAPNIQFGKQVHVGSNWSFPFSLFAEL